MAAVFDPSRQRGTQLPSVANPPRLPLVTTVQNRDASFTKDARLVNAFAELEPVSGDYKVERRVGLLTYQTKSGNGLGVYNWNGVVYSIQGTTLYKDGVSFGTVDGTSVYFFEKLLGTGWLVLNNGAAAYYTDGTTLTALATFLPVLSGAFFPTSKYEIVSPGTTDFVAIGAANNNVGTQFTATGLGVSSKTGTAALVAGSLIVGVRYKINTLGTTDFTTVGAASNTVGIVFTATGVGTGTGSVFSPNFPESHVKGWAYLDGTLYVMDSAARIYGTSTLQFGGIGGFDDPRVWDPLNVIVARTGPGRGVALVRHLSYVVALKDESTEFFYDAGNATGSPLSTVQGAYSVHGCASADSVQDIKETLFWLTIGSTAAPQVAMLTDLKVEIISTPPLERTLRNADFSSVLSWNLDHCGHKFYGVTIVAANITLVYDNDQQLWYQWTDPSGNYWPIVANAVGVSAQASLTQHRSNGKIYLTAADYIYPDDDGVIFPVDIYTPIFDGETDRRKSLGAMYFKGDQVATSELEVRVSDDDYQSWSAIRRVDLSRKLPMLSNCGTFTKRAWWLRHNKRTKFRIDSVSVQLDLGIL